MNGKHVLWNGITKLSCAHRSDFENIVCMKRHIERCDVRSLNHMNKSVMTREGRILIHNNQKSCFYNSTCIHCFVWVSQFHIKSFSEVKSINNFLLYGELILGFLKVVWQIYILVSFRQQTLFHGQRHDICVK